MERVFDADNYIAVFGGKKGSIDKPGRIVSWGNFLLDFSKDVLPDVKHSFVAAFWTIIACEGEFSTEKWVIKNVL